MVSVWPGDPNRSPCSEMGTGIIQERGSSFGLAREGGDWDPPLRSAPEQV